MDKIKNCPFCGSNARKEGASGPGPKYIKCSNCNAKIGPHKVYIHAIGAWNTRTNSAQTKDHTDYNNLLAEKNSLYTETEQLGIELDSAISMRDKFGRDIDDLEQTIKRLNEQLNKAVELVTDWIGMKPETEHEIYIASKDFLSTIKEQS